MPNPNPHQVGLEKNPHETPSSRVLQHGPHPLQPPAREAAVQARTAPHISLYLPISPHISIYLPISPLYLPEREAAVQALTPTPTPTPQPLSLTLPLPLAPSPYP